MRFAYFIFKYLISLVWLVNGLYCKILNLVPRHQQIVSRILSEGHSRALTVIIGVSEVLMGIWIISGIAPRLNAWCQVALVLAMNFIEFFLAQDLLLFGKLNIVFAFLFSVIILVNEYIIRSKALFNKALYNHDKRFS